SLHQHGSLRLGQRQALPGSLGQKARRGTPRRALRTVPRVGGGLRADNRSPVLGGSVRSAVGWSRRAVPPSRARPRHTRVGGRLYQGTPQTAAPWDTRPTFFCPTRCPGPAAAGRAAPGCGRSGTNGDTGRRRDEESRPPVTASAVAGGLFLR